MLHCSVPYDPNPIQGHGQGHGGGPKVAKMTDLKVYHLYQYTCNQKTNGELWHSKTISKFSPRFLMFAVVRRHVTFKLRALHLRQTNFAFYEESTGSLVSGLFICFSFLSAYLLATCGRLSRIPSAVSFLNCRIVSL